MNRIESEKYPDLIYPVVSIRDNCTGFYPCNCEQSIQAAKRNFSMAINSMQGVMAFSPADFTLFHVANFNVEKGIVEPVYPIEQVVTGLEVYGEKHEES